MPVKDRLEELHKARAARGELGADGVTGVTGATGATGVTGVTGAAPPAAGGRADALVRRAADQAEKLHAWVGELRRGTERLRRIHADPTFHANRELQEQLDDVISEWNGNGARVCGALGALEALAGEGAAGGAGARAARLQLAAARASYAAALRAHSAALLAVRDQRALLLHTQLRLTNLSISDDECEALLDSKNLSLFVDNVRAETEEARLALRAAEARHQELARVEAALGDVRDLFARLQLLVAQQQDQLDSVQHFALQATDYVGSGERQLLSGVVKRTRARKKRTQLIICLVVGFLVILLVLIIT